MDPVSLVQASTGPILAALGSVAGAWWQRRRHQAAARLAEAQAAAAEEDTRDARWERQIRTLTEHIIVPLRDEVGDLRREVHELRTEVDQLRTRYWRAISYVRALLAWSQEHHHRVPEPPPPPSEIASDI